jgi:tetratricopeptide (TPR) repeat protein
MSVQILHDSDHFRVLARKGASSFGLITFSPATQFAEGTRFWGDAIVTKADITAIGIMAHRPNWFPEEEMSRAAHAIRAHFAGLSQVIGYGSSMGGYAAVKFSALFGMTHVLSFAPQWSIAPADVGSWDNRFLHRYDKWLNQNVAVQSKDVQGKVFLFYDPFLNVDEKNAQLIAERCSDVTTIKAYLTGHFPVETFKGTQAVMSLFEAALAGDIDAIRQTVQQKRRMPGSPLRPRALADIYAAKDIRLTRQVLVKYPSAFGPRELGNINHTMAGILLRDKRLDEAARCADAAISVFPEQTDFLLRRGQIDTQRGDLDGALNWAQQAVARRRNAQNLLAVSNALARLGRVDEAKEICAAALTLDDRNPNAISAMIAAAKADNKFEDRVAWARRLVEVRPDAASHMRLSEVYNDASQFDEGAEVLTSGIAAEPNNIHLHLRLAQTYVSGGRLSKAVDAANEAIRLSPNDITAWTILFRAANRVGFTEKAFAAKQVLERLNPALAPVPETPKSRSWFQRLFSRSHALTN